MDHNKINLFSLNDQELSEHERQEILMHIEVCNDCNGKLKTWNSASNILSRLPEPEYSSSFVNSVMEKLPNSHEKGFFSLFGINPWLIPSLAVATLVLLFYMPLLSKQATINTENLLLAELPDDTYNWAFSTTEPDINLLFGSSSEEL